MLGNFYSKCENRNRIAVYDFISDKTSIDVEEWTKTTFINSMMEAPYSKKQELFLQSFEVLQWHQVCFPSLEGTMGFVSGNKVLKEQCGRETSDAGVTGGLMVHF